MPVTSFASLRFSLLAILCQLAAAVLPLQNKCWLNRTATILVADAKSSLVLCEDVAPAVFYSIKTHALFIKFVLCDIFCNRTGQFANSGIFFIHEAVFNSEAGYTARLYYLCGCHFIWSPVKPAAARPG